MSTADSTTSWWRFSLRELILLIGFVAVACVSLKYAGFVWILILSAAVLLFFMGAVVVALVDRGRRQAEAIGFAAVAAIYGVLYWSSPDLPNTTENQELYSHSGRLPTSKALHPLAQVIVRDYWVDSTGKEIVGYDPTTAGGMGMGGMGMGGMMGGGGMGGFGSGPQYRQVPYHPDFMAVGHLLWTLLLGYLGSRLALWSYERRSKSEL